MPSLINLHPLEPLRNRVRLRRARMTAEQRAAMHVSEAKRQRDRRAADPTGVRAAELARYQSGTRKATNLAAAWRHRLRKYGLTQASYDALVTAQGNRCACCAATEPGRGDTRWCIDHSHVTLVVRGLVCHRCNTAIALLGDNAEGVRKALAYLERSEG